MIPRDQKDYDHAAKRQANIQKVREQFDDLLEIEGRERFRKAAEKWLKNVEAIRPTLTGKEEAMFNGLKKAVEGLMVYGGGDPYGNGSNW